MEVLQNLERKIAQLLAFCGELKAENAQLVEQNEQLLRKLTTVSSQELDQERLKTKVFVDELIKSIDNLIGTSKPS